MKITYMNYKILKNSIVSLVIISLFFCANLALASSPVYSGLDIAVKGTNLASDPIKMFGNIVGVVIGLLGVALIVLIIYGGFIWMTAGGDTKKVEKGRDIIKNAVIGLVIVFAAYAITQFVLTKMKNISGSSGASSGVNSELNQNNLDELNAMPY